MLNMTRPHSFCRNPEICLELDLILTVHERFQMNLFCFFYSIFSHDRILHPLCLRLSLELRILKFQPLSIAFHGLWGTSEVLTATLTKFD